MPYERVTGSDNAPLTAEHVLEYPYTRSVGRKIGRFLAELREQRIVGIRAADGRVLVPAVDCDPLTGDETTEEFVEVGPAGVVFTWCWVSRPREKQPLSTPFAWALIRLDGADTAMLHAIDAGDPARMKRGMRVQPRWREERGGAITDIECFVPVGEGK